MRHIKTQSIVKKSMIILFLLGLTFSITAQEKIWTIDTNHSSINFGITHFAISTVKGGFDKFSATIKQVETDFNNAQLNVSIETSSINTSQSGRDKDLRGPVFFNAEKHPEITYRSTSFKKVSDTKYVVKGNLTMNGITKEIVLNAVYKGQFYYPRIKDNVAVFEMNGIVSRVDYKLGLKYPVPALGKEVKIAVNIEMNVKK